MKFQVAINQAEALRQGIDATASRFVFDLTPQELTERQRGLLADRLVQGFFLVKKSCLPITRKPENTDLISVIHTTQEELFQALEEDERVWEDKRDDSQNEVHSAALFDELERSLLSLSPRAKNICYSGRFEAREGYTPSIFAGELLLDDAIGVALNQEWDRLLPAKEPQGVATAVPLEWDVLNTLPTPYAHIFIETQTTDVGPDTVGYVVTQPVDSFNVGTIVENPGLTPESLAYLDGLAARVSNLLGYQNEVSYQIVYGLFDRQAYGRPIIAFELLIEWKVCYRYKTAAVVATHYSCLHKLYPWKFWKKSNLREGSPEQLASKFVSTYEGISTLVGAPEASKLSFLLGDPKPLWDHLLSRYAPQGGYLSVISSIQKAVPHLVLGPVLILDADFVRHFNLVDPWAYFSDGYIGVNSLVSGGGTEVDWPKVYTGLAALQPLLEDIPPAPHFQNLAATVGSYYRSHPKTLTEKNSGAWYLVFKTLNYLE